MQDIPKTNTEKWVGWTLRGGVWTSALLMSIGIFLAPFFPHNSNPVFPEAITWPPALTTFLHAGLLLLMLTPFLRVTATLLSFLRERDWRFVFISFLVFIMLLTELIIAFS